MTQVTSDSKIYLTFCMQGKVHVFAVSSGFFQNLQFQKFFRERYQSVKRQGSCSECKPKLFPKVISSRQKSPLELNYSKTRVKRQLSKRPKNGFRDQLSLNAGQKDCNSAILSTFIKLLFVNKIFLLSIFEWPFYTGFTVVLLPCITQGNDQTTQ